MTRAKNRDLHHAFASASIRGNLSSRSLQSTQSALLRLHGAVQHMTLLHDCSCKVSNMGIISLLREGKGAVSLLLSSQGHCTALSKRKRILHSSLRVCSLKGQQQNGQCSGNVETTSLMSFLLWEPIQTKLHHERSLPCRLPWIMQACAVLLMTIIE